MDGGRVLVRLGVESLPHEPLHSPPRTPDRSSGTTAIRCYDSLAPPRLGADRPQPRSGSDCRPPRSENGNPLASTNLETLPSASQRPTGVAGSFPSSSPQSLQ